MLVYHWRKKMVVYPFFTALEEDYYYFHKPSRTGLCKSTVRKYFNFYLPLENTRVILNKQNLVGGDAYKVKLDGNGDLLSLDTDRTDPLILNYYTGLFLCEQFGRKPFYIWGETW